MTRSVLGIVGGSGLYDIPALRDVHWEPVKSSWGEPSDQILFAELEGLPKELEAEFESVRPLAHLNIMSPPLILTEVQVDELVDKLAAGIRATVDGLVRDGHRIA